MFKVQTRKTEADGDTEQPANSKLGHVTSKDSLVSMIWCCRLSFGMNELITAGLTSMDLQYGYSTDLILYIIRNYSLVVYYCLVRGSLK